MSTKSFFGQPKPSFCYELSSKVVTRPAAVSPAKTVTLLLPDGEEPKVGTTVNIGDSVKTGQKISWEASEGPSVIASVTGTVVSISPHLGDYGRKYAAITIEVDKNDTWDESFTGSAGQSAPKIQDIIDYLSTAPGGAPFAYLSDPKRPVKTLIIYGGDTDLLVETNLYVLNNRISAVNDGIRILKEAAGIETAILAVPGESFQNFDGHFNADKVFAVPNEYPGGQPLMIYYQIFGKIIEQGRTFEDEGVLFVSTEAVASVGMAYRDARLPVEKIVTVLDKRMQKHLVSVRIGTPLGDVLKALNISLKDKDRIIFGGPMTGMAVYSEDQPIQPDTNAVMVQEGEDIILTTDYPCINCGECIGVCPSRIQINMLVRFLEAGQYQDAADLYDLYSCVECGLCAFVCPSRIPILQYIKLAKYELARMTPAEEENE